MDYHGLSWTIMDYHGLPDWSERPQILAQFIYDIENLGPGSLVPKVWLNQQKNYSIIFFEARVKNVKTISRKFYATFCLNFI